MTDGIDHEYPLPRGIVQHDLAEGHPTPTTGGKFEKIPRGSLMKQRQAAGDGLIPVGGEEFALDPHFTHPAFVCRVIGQKRRGDKCHDCHDERDRRERRAAGETATQAG